MKKKSWIMGAVIVILALALVFCFFQIQDLREQVDRLDTQYSYALANLRDEINGIYANVDRQLEEQGSLLSGVECTYGNLAEGAPVVDVFITVIPKERTDDMTLYVSIDGGVSLMEREGNEFHTVIPVSLFLDNDAKPLLTIEAAGKTQSEYLDEVDVANLWCYYLPRLYYADMGSEYGSEKLTVRSPLTLDLEPAAGESGATFRKFTLVTERNGEETAREDITNAVMTDQTYADGICMVDYEASYKIADGEELEIWVEAEDTLGFNHRVLAFYWFKNGNAMAEFVSGNEFIYDGDGNLLYGTE